MSVFRPLKAHVLLLAALLTTLVITGCDQTEETSAPPTTAATTAPAAEHDFDTQLLMFRDPNCGCCTDWADHVEENGLTISNRDSDQMARIKREFGIAGQYQSCHTAVWHEHPYVFEGHVPARFIQQFLADPPADAIGLAVPRMPFGSPGMEIDDRFDPYEVLLLKADGSASVYARVDSPDQQY